MKNEQLVVDNMKLVYHVIHKCYPSLSKDEDLIQCGMYGLCKAADTFDSEKGKFSSYACKCIHTAILMELRTRRKHYGVLSLDAILQNNDGNDVSAINDYIGSEDDVIVGDHDKFYKSLTDKEREVYDLLEKGLKQREIAEIIGKTRSYVSLYKQRIRKKWRKYFGD